MVNYLDVSGLESRRSRDEVQIRDEDSRPIGREAESREALPWREGLPWHPAVPRRRTYQPARVPREGVPGEGTLVLGPPDLGPVIPVLGPPDLGPRPRSSVLRTSDWLYLVLGTTCLGLIITY